MKAALVINGERLTRGDLLDASNPGTANPVTSGVERVLVAQYGRQEGLHLADEQFRSIVENIRRQQAVATDDEFAVLLRQEGLTADVLRQRLERQMINERLKLRTASDVDWLRLIAFLRDRADIQWHDAPLRDSYNTGK